MKPIIVIVGPTAVGKSRLALELAQALDGEIVSADSRQVYRYMDIGTAKPGPRERSFIRHHLLDLVDPDQDFSLALYQELALQAIEDTQQRGKLVILAGGSGLYVWSLVEGWRIPKVSPDPELRRELEARAKSEGAQALYEELKKLDPVAAQRIDFRNLRRLVRALEVCRRGGGLFSQLRRKELFPPFSGVSIIGLTADRAELYRRIDDRVDGMLQAGLVKEVEGLVAKGFSIDLPSMSSLGYKEIGMYLQGKLDLSAAVQRIKYQTHRLARHQYAWFRLSDSRIRWFDARDRLGEQVRTLTEEFVLGRVA